MELAYKSTPLVEHANSDLTRDEFDLLAESTTQQLCELSVRDIGQGRKTFYDILVTGSTPSNREYLEELVKKRFPQFSEKPGQNAPRIYCPYYIDLDEWGEIKSHRTARGEELVFYFSNN